MNKKQNEELYSHFFPETLLQKKEETKYTRNKMKSCISHFFPETLLQKKEERKYTIMQKN
jgi:hypothetical protein